GDQVGSAARAPDATSTAIAAKMKRRLIKASSSARSRRITLPAHGSIAGELQGKGHRTLRCLCECAEWEGPRNTSRRVGNAAVAGGKTQDWPSATQENAAALHAPTGPALAATTSGSLRRLSARWSASAFHLGVNPDSGEPP